MFFLPFQILGVWLKGLLAFALLGLGVYLLKDWYDHRTVVVPSMPEARVVDRDGDGRGEVVLRRETWQFGWNRETAELLGGLGLVGLSLGGGLLVGTLARGLTRGGGPMPEAPMGEVRRLQRPDGTELHVETFGPVHGPILVLTHGWGVDSREWLYVVRAMGGSHRIIVWDLPGLGRSTEPTNRDYSLDKMARDLDAVLELAEGRPATLVGHSIGGMINLTYARLFPESLGTRVSGLVQVHTTYTNPVATTRHAAIYTALQKPVLEPLLYLTIALWPLIWLMNAMSYLNGSAHRSNERSSFSGSEPRGQLEFMTRYTLQASPAVLARGMFGMLRYDATETLAHIPVPVLVVPGDRDDLTPPEASHTMTRGIPRATFAPLANAKHEGHFEHHDVFVDALRQFATASRPAAVPSA